MTPLTINDIQIFLLTFNRTDLLRKTIESVLRQTVPVSQITVLDNGGFPATKQLVLEFDEQRVGYENSTAYGLFGNLLLAQRLLDKKYVLLLHDDDLIHPEYLDLVLLVLNAKPSLKLVTCRTIPWPVETEPAAHPHLNRLGHFFSQQEYATFVYNAGHPSYSLAIYEAAAFKSVNIVKNFECYGKWGDVPLMIETIGDGYAAVLMDTCGWMGVHSGQDSNDPSNRPRYRSWISRESNFSKLLGDDPKTFPGLSFCIMNYRHLRSGFRRRVKCEVTFSQYLEEARAAKALTKRSQLFRFLAPRFVQKVFERWVTRHFQESAKPLV